MHHYVISNDNILHHNHLPKECMTLDLFASLLQAAQSLRRVFHKELSNHYSFLLFVSYLFVVLYLFCPELSFYHQECFFLFKSDNTDNIDHIDNTYTYPFTDVLCLFTNGLGVGNLNKQKHGETLLTCRISKKSGNLFETY